MKKDDSSGFDFYGIIQSADGSNVVRGASGGGDLRRGKVAAFLFARAKEGARGIHSFKEK